MYPGRYARTQPNHPAVIMAGTGEIITYGELEARSNRLAHFLRSRGLSEEEAAAMIVNGFIEPVTKELPMEYAIELNRLIQLEMIGSIG